MDFGDHPRFIVTQSRERFSSHSGVEHSVDSIKEFKSHDDQAFTEKNERSEDSLADAPDFTLSQDSESEEDGSDFEIERYNLMKEKNK